MISMWASIVQVLNIFTLSPSDGGANEQYPLAIFSQLGSIPAAPSGPALKTVPPSFTPPSVPSWYKDFKCEYPSMVDYEPCSTPGDRSCWLKDKNAARGRDYNISTDYERVAPKGITRKYYLDLAKKTIAPDGKSRETMLINGSFPGPWIQACWGDELEITVKNSLKDNGTSIHWHGIRQLGTIAHDGVNAITQCPIAPGKEFTYRFKALQYGTSWYHSHYSLQYGEGALGPLTIHGPSSADYDEALDPVMMTDWAWTSWFTQWWNQAITPQTQPGVVNNILVNGTGTATNKPSKEFRLNFTTSKRYLLRLINHSVEAAFIFSIDNHKIQVVGADFVPIEPYMTDHVVVGIGQRYHIIVTANPMDGHIGSFWMRTAPAVGCNPGLGGVDNRTGIIRYGNDQSEPVDYPYKIDATCRDEPYDKLVPKLKWEVGKPVNFAANAEFDIRLDNLDASTKFPGDIVKGRWNMYSDTMWLDFANPSLAQNLTRKQGEWDANSVVVVQDAQPEQWIYFLVSGTGIPQTGRQYIPIAHPIHLHGHDFAILQQSTVPYQIGNLNLNHKNPPRRDVAFLPRNGFLVLAFKADNPGTWLMHCHIAWHASGGLAMQIVENGANVTRDLSHEDEKHLKETCDGWNEWVNRQGAHFIQDDSGI